MFLIDHIFKSFYSISSIIFSVMTTKKNFKGSFLESHSISHFVSVVRIWVTFQRSCKELFPTHFPRFFIPFDSCNCICAYNLSKRLPDITPGKARVDALPQIFTGFVSEALYVDISHFHLCQVWVCRHYQMLKEELNRHGFWVTLGKNFLNPSFCFYKPWGGREIALLRSLQGSLP